MSAKKYGIYRISAYIDKGQSILYGGNRWFFEVSFTDFGGTTNILRREHIPGCDSFKWAESVGLQWLYDHLEKQLQEVKEALNTL